MNWEIYGLLAGNNLRLKNGETKRVTADRKYDFTPTSINRVSAKTFRINFAQTAKRSDVIAEDFSKL